MSEEADSSSMAVTGSKHARQEEQGENEPTSNSKRQKVDVDSEAGPCTSSGEAGAGGGSGEGVTGSGDGVTGSGDGVTGSGEGAAASESDEEYQLGESDGEEAGEDAESSDISADEEGEEEEEEEVGEAEGTSIICGQPVELREMKEGQYRLYHEETGREMKLLLSADAVSDAEKLAREMQADKQIAVLDAKGSEVTRDERDEVIVYATSLAATDSKYNFFDGEINHKVSEKKSSTLLQGNKLVVVRVEGVKEIFATADFNTQEVED